MAIYTKRIIWASTNNAKHIDFTFKGDLLKIGFLKTSCNLTAHFTIDTAKERKVMRVEIRKAAYLIVQHFGVSCVETTKIAIDIRRMIQDYIC